MKRLSLCLLSCVVLAATGWLAHSVLGQTTEPAQEKTFKVTQSQLDKYVADQVAKAVAADHEKAGHAAAGPVSDEQVLKSENWHLAVFNKAAYVVYTGPGQAMFHHWVAPKTSGPPSTGAAPATPPGR